MCPTVVELHQIFSSGGADKCAFLTFLAGSTPGPAFTTAPPCHLLQTQISRLGTFGGAALLGMRCAFRGDLQKLLLNVCLRDVRSSLKSSPLNLEFIFNVLLKELLGLPRLATVANQPAARGSSLAAPATL